MAKGKFNYNEALAEVKQIIEELNQGETDLETMTDKVKIAAGLLQECKNKLRQTETELNSILDALEEGD